MNGNISVDLGEVGNEGEYVFSTLSSKRRVEEMMKKMQKNKVDSLGIGKYVRNSLSYAKWTQLDWDAIYPSVDVKFNVSVEIKNYGKFEK